MLKRPATTAEPATTDRRRRCPSPTARSTRWAGHPKDSGATPQHSGQNAPKPLQARLRGSAMCRSRQNATTPCQANPETRNTYREPAQACAEAQRNTPINPSDRIVPVERGAMIDTEALEKEPGFMMTPQLHKMPRPPRPRQSLRTHTRHRLQRYATPTDAGTVRR